MKKVRGILFLWSVIMLGSCSKEPDPHPYGEDGISINIVSIEYHKYVTAIETSPLLFGNKESLVLNEEGKNLTVIAFDFSGNLNLKTCDGEFLEWSENLNLVTDDMFQHLFDTQTDCTICEEGRERIVFNFTNRTTKYSKLIDMENQEVFEDLLSTLREEYNSMLPCQ